MEGRAIMAVSDRAPKTLLLGGGYTLQKLACTLPEGSFVITSRSHDRCAEWRKRGWIAERVAIDSPDGVNALFTNYPSLRVVIDSVPPLPEEATKGVSIVANAVRNSSIMRLVYLSTTGVFGVDDGSVVTETTECHPQSPGGKARKECEDVYRTLSDKCEVTVLRLPAIYGFDRGLLFALRSGRYRLIGDGAQWTNRIHVDDLVKVLHACIETSKALPLVLCVSDDTPSQAAEVVSFVCRKEELAMPPSITRAEAMARGLHTMLSNQRVDNTVMKKTLGIELTYPSYVTGFHPKDTE